MRGVLGPSWTLLGRSWDPLGRSWGALGPSWGALGALLARSSSLPHPKIRREKLRRAISDDFGSILVDFPDKNLRDPSENLRNPAENLPPSAVPRTPKNKLGCGGRAKRVQSAAPCVYAGSEAFIDNTSYFRTPSELGELASPYPSTGLRETADPLPSGKSLPDPVNCFCLRQLKLSSWRTLGRS